MAEPNPNPTTSAQPTNPNPSPQPSGSMEEAFKDIAGLVEQPAQPAPAVTPTPSPEPKSEKAPSKVTEKPSTDKPAAAQPKPEEFKTNKQLRDAYDARVSEVNLLKQELAQAKNDGASKKELESIREQLKTLTTERDELASEMRYASFERSPEYKTNYVEPIKKAFASAYEAMDELTVVNPDDNTERKATADDFNVLLNLNLGQASKKAKEMFGDASADVLQRRSRILELEKSRKEAIAEWKTKSSDRESQLSSQQQKFVEATRERFNSYRDAASKRFPDLYAPSEGDSDPEGNTLLERGDSLVKKAFGLSEEKLTHEQLTDLQAEVANRAKAFGRLVLRNNRLSQEVSDLKAKIKAYEDAEAGHGSETTTAGGSHASMEDQADAEIAALASSQ